MTSWLCREPNVYRSQAHIRSCSMLGMVCRAGGLKREGVWAINIEFLTERYASLQAFHSHPATRFRLSRRRLDLIGS
jgi:hypothetical protein